VQCRYVELNYRPRYAGNILDNIRLDWTSSTFITLDYTANPNIPADNPNLDKIGNSEKKGQSFGIRRHRSKRSIPGIIARTAARFSPPLEADRKRLTAGPSRATAGHPKTFSRGPEIFSRGPSREKICEFYSDVFYISERRRGPQTSRGPGYSLPPCPTLSTDLFDISIWEIVSRCNFTSVKVPFSFSRRSSYVHSPQSQIRH